MSQVACIHVTTDRFYNFSQTIDLQNTVFDVLARDDVGQIVIDLEKCHFAVPALAHALHALCDESHRRDKKFSCAGYNKLSVEHSCAAGKKTNYQSSQTHHP